MKTPVQDLETFSDNALMLKVKDGHLDKLGLLFERYKKPLFGFFYGMSKDAELSEDLVQNVFFRILKYRYLFRGEGDFKTWMFHIARNVNHDHYRKNKLGKAESVESWENRLGHDDAYSVQLQQDEETKMLTLALDRLPVDKREIILLSKYQEKKYKEIGEILGCSEGAVKVKVFRALQELKAVYQQLEKQM
ncbi:MAG TPA: RNA polymerase sigma factor [Cyclobacteriaceae bacterium]|nr:RNA polymerase sigma factor [Cyclobacteriaceae bacterium]HMV89992.1 RNA polymerase sigma factor [Cyclobacteriaceae bacterium]HMW99800.1 RNA polymerase sigma factor [Cyclobacteriaceae bacterium]HMX50192.1 RNA polymerase sigma factor [Cyclobacteriaceae bacterium]HMY92621.1 RNA polymerase sigma factor [Cyclobacteriaceae bacterium]